MGVRGLQSFIKNNDGIAQNIRFNDSSLVIDACNLLCCMYCQMVEDHDGPQARSDVYGGDLVSYAQLLREFFASLDRCNITPILVFDGSVIGKKSTQDELILKDREIYRRALERFQMAQQASEDPPAEKINMPSIINNIFKLIATELGIQKIQTPYEADSHIARIANDLNCPVLTNDSDFLIYSLPQGFIMLDYFNFKNVKLLDAKKSCIECTIYSQSKLSKFLPGLRRETLPLLSILLGNDYVEPGTFDRITESICRVPYHGPLRTQSWSHRRIASLLDWLKGKSLDEAIHQILDQLPPNRQAPINKIIRILLRNYHIEETDNFEQELSIIYPAIDGSTEQPPVYLRRLFEQGSFSAAALDIALHNTHYNYQIIDDFTLPSSSYVKYRPYSLAVTLMRPKSYSNLTTYQRQVACERDAWTLYDRVRGEYNKITIRPIECLDEFGSLEHLNLYTTIVLEPELKKNLIMETFRFNREVMNLMSDSMSQIFKPEYVQESCICLLLVRYCGLETKMAPKPQFIDALLLTFIYYAALNGQLKPDSIKDEQYGKILLHLRPHTFKNNGRQYAKNSKLYRRIVHFIAQLQAALYVYNLLNGILNYPLYKSRVERFMNGTLIFRLTKFFRTGEMKFDEICRDIPVLLDTSGTLKLMTYCDE